MTDLNGFLVVDKPAGMTSREVVNTLGLAFRDTKIGHAGTLDPAATGVLAVAVGSSAVRLVEYVQDQEKVYETAFHLGARSSTDDAEGELTSFSGATPPSFEQVQASLPQFLGTIEQVPPAYSAVRVDGVRAHTRARRGEAVIVKPRLVTIHEINLLRYEYPLLELTIRCSKGTYIRSIARDLGEVLGTGGYVHTLRRLRIGTLTTNHVVPLDADRPTLEAALLPMEVAVIHLERCDLTTEESIRLQQGQKILSKQAFQRTPVSLWIEGQFLGVAHYEASSGRLCPSKIVAYSL